MLRSQTNQLKRLRNENRRLQASLAKTGPNPEPQEVDPGSTERDTAIAKMNDAKLLVLGQLLYAGDNTQQVARSLDQLEPYLHDKTPILTGTNQFELVFQGSLQDIRNPPQIIVLREKQGWQASDGSWHRAYGFADGHSELHRASDGDFEPWEEQHMFSPPPAGQLPSAKYRERRNLRLLRMARSVAGAQPAWARPKGAERLSWTASWRDGTQPVFTGAAAALAIPLNILLARVPPKE